ncbi:MAG: hypothetical protein HQL24_10075 [Candidatus Omnitrophica bacterium]|nr:hypothetical protein [Candidatus Omnitrophota bacterium]
MKNTPPRKAESILFLSVLTLELFFAGFFILSKRMVLHDTFANFSFQYFCLNNIVMHKEIPFWTPYMVHGIPTAFWQLLWHSLTMSALNTAGFLLNPHLNFLTIFRLNLLFNKIVFLVGAWLLSQRCYKETATRFFVAITCLATSVYETQVTNLSLCYSIPLLLYLFHQFLDSGRWRDAFLGINLLCLSIIGNYVLFTLIPLFLFLYFLSYIIFHPEKIKTLFIKLNFKIPFLLFLLSTLATITITYAIFHLSRDPLTVFINSGRTENLRVTPDEFMSLG